MSEDSPAEPLSSRRASARRRLVLATSAGLLALVAAVAGAFYLEMRPVSLRIAVGPAGDDLKLIQALGQHLNRTHSYVRLKPVPTDSAAASAEALAQGKVDLAVIRGDLDVPKNAQAVATLRKNVVVLWTVTAKGRGRKSGITKVGQLAGRRVGVIGRTEANANLLKIILQQYGVDPGKVDIAQLPATDSAEAIRGQKADAYLAAGPINSRLIADAIAASARDGTPTFLAIDAAEAIAQNRPAYEASLIPAGSLGGSPAQPDDEVKTIGFDHHIVARKGLSDTTVAAFARQLFSVRRQLIHEFPLAAKIETPDTDKDAVVPVHPGAAAFVDGEEKTFLDRYSDYIWWSLMALSAMGSLGAWLAGYLKKDERETNTSLRERLLEMIPAARRCDSADELDRMQEEADGILRATLLCFDRGVIEEASLTAFNVALEQFHNAVADRRALLIAMPQSLQRAGASFRATGAL